MRVHVVFAHPSHDSFTGSLLRAFLDGLDEAGHTHTLSDLYAKHFNPVLDAVQYEREAGCHADEPVPPDVSAEQHLLDAAGAWVFCYPVWWTDCPAILKGWFDRVWSVGYAYEPGYVRKNLEGSLHSQTTQPVAELALILCAAGHTEDELRRTGCYQAMETTMLVDRIATRAQHKRFVVLGGSADLGADAWTKLKVDQLAAASWLGRNLDSLVTPASHGPISTQRTG